ncbi:MAG: hypothetical protein WCI20_11370 [bacterium]
MVEELKAAFLDKKTIQVPNYQYISNPKYDELFNKAADICMKEDVDAFRFVQAVWNATTNKEHFYVKTLTEAPARNAAKLLAADFKTDWKKSFDQQVRVVQNYVQKSGWNFRDVLLYPDNGLYGWFRIISTAERDEKIIEEYKSIARMEMTKDLKKFLIEKKYAYERITD